MRTEREQMENGFSERMAESSSQHARNKQNMIIDDDVQLELKNHLEIVENATMKSLEKDKEIWDVSEAHNQTLNTMEEKTIQLMQHVSQMDTNGLQFQNEG